MSSAGRFLMQVGGLSGGLSTIKDAIPSSGQSNMHIACGTLEGKIKENAPVDTGHLRGSIEYRVESSGDKIIGHVGTNVPYAVHVEYGTQHMAAQPFIRPAVESEKQNLVKIMAADTLAEAVSHAR